MTMVQHGASVGVGTRVRKGSIIAGGLHQWGQTYQLGCPVGGPQNPSTCAMCSTQLYLSRLVVRRMILTWKLTRDVLLRML